jgi:hypothetical protein
MDTLRGKARARLRRALARAIVAPAFLLGACGDPYVPPVLEAIRPESGDQQTGVAGGPLPNPLVVGAYNQLDAPIAGARVEFSAASGSFDQSVKFSGADGRAQVVYTLGPTPGPVTIRATTKAGELVVEFTAFGEPGEPTTLRSVSGDGQTGVAGAPLPAPLRVRVTNQNGVGLPDVVVRWTVQGQGEVSDTSSSTDSAGYAQVTFTLGGEPGAHTVTATAGGLSSVTFTATATAPPPPEEPGG